MDIVVTTPKREMKTAAAEAAQCIGAGGGSYFRRFTRQPKELKVGDRIFYVENGWLTGFAIVSTIGITRGVVCETTGRLFHGPGYFVFMDATSWKWVRPIPFSGFQGFRYASQMFTDDMIEIIGDWRDEKPDPVEYFRGVIQNEKEKEACQCLRQRISKAAE